MSDVPNEKPIPPPPELAENIDALAEVKIPTTVSDGIYKNLVSQIDSILAYSNERSIKSRYRYYEATKRFCRFLADNYRLQKFKNVEDRHFRAYVKYLKENNEATTIQTDLSGIRYFHEKSSSKNKLSENLHVNSAHLTSNYTSLANFFGSPGAIFLADSSLGQIQLDVFG